MTGEPGTSSGHPFAAGSENPSAPPTSPLLNTKPAHVTKDLAVAQAAVAFAGLCTAATRWFTLMTTARIVKEETTCPICGKIHHPNQPGGEQDGRR
jgi:hypothetical protein